MFPTVNAVLYLSASSLSTCQYPLRKSNFEKYLEPISVSIVSFMRGKLYASLTVRLFNFLKPMPQPLFNG